MNQPITGNVRKRGIILSMCIIIATTYINKYRYLALNYTAPNNAKLFFRLKLAIHFVPTCNFQEIEK